MTTVTFAQHHIGKSPPIPAEPLPGQIPMLFDIKGSLPFPVLFGCYQDTQTPDTSLPTHQLVATAISLYPLFLQSLAAFVVRFRINRFL